jgi:transcriptional regulator with XRE-family HTH domain
MKERILEFLKAENKSSAIFAEEIGVQPSSISHILSGRNNPSLDFVLKMLKRYPYLSTDWLLFGKSTMYIDSSQQNLFAQDDPSGREPVDKKFEFILDNTSKNEAVKDFSLPDQPDIHLPGDSKRAIRIVYFFDDNTYREYFPEEHR